MFNWVGSQFDAVLSTYVLSVVSALMTAITPIALSAMTIWVALYGWAVLRNEVSETLPTFMWKVFKIGLVLAFALQSGFYISGPQGLRRHTECAASLPVPHRRGGGQQGVARRRDRQPG